MEEMSCSACVQKERRKKKLHPVENALPRRPSTTSLRDGFGGSDEGVAENDHESSGRMRGGEFGECRA